MEYGRIVKRAWEVTWRNKVLWVFGIAAALFSANGNTGGGSSWQYRFAGQDLQSWRNLPWLQGSDMGSPGSNLQALGGVLASFAVLAILVGLAVFLVGIVVRYTSLGALIGGVNEVEEHEATSFKSSFDKGWSRFLRLFAIDLLIMVGVIVFVIAFSLVAALGIVLVVAPAVAIGQAGGPAAIIVAIVWGILAGLALLLLLIVIGLIASVVVTLVREFAFRACILDHKDVFASLGSAFKLLRSKLRQAGLMWLLLLGIKLALGLLMLPLALLAIGGIIGPAVATYGMTRSLPAALVVMLPIALLVGLVEAAVQGVVLTFFSSVWTLTYRELRTPVAPALAEPEPATT